MAMERWIADADVDDDGDVFHAMLSSVYTLDLLHNLQHGSLLDRLDNDQGHPHANYMMNIYPKRTSILAQNRIYCHGQYVLMQV